MSGLLVLGDALLDRDVDGSATRLAPDAPVPVVDEHEVRVRPGGAGLAAVLAAGDGREVTLVTALSTDGAGRELRGALATAGVEVVDLGLRGATPEKIRIHAEGRPVVRLDRGCDDCDVGALTAAARAAIEWAGAVLVADYGRGVAAEPTVRAALERAAAAGTPIVWDPHPKGPEPVRGATVVTPNAKEAGADTADLDDCHERARRLARAFGAEHVCITRGAQGAVLARATDPSPIVVPAAAVVGDPCGAGDRFAAALAGALADGEPPAAGVQRAVQAATAFVAAGGARGWRPRSAAPAPTASRDGTTRHDRVKPSLDGLGALAEVRGRGGTVVATGGCFDLLHAGHVQTLRAARALGDALVVLLNSDASVRRLKGPTRPINGQEDRAAVLQALGCVDAVVVFDEDTPERALAELEPHLWAKGGDYAGQTLPEDAVLQQWGGRTVILPHLPGRSTTTIIEEAACRQAS